MICAGAILRLHLDTVLRFFAGFIVDKPHDFASDVLKGHHIRKMKDRSGQLMTDSYLVTKLAKFHPWIKDVYHKTSGYIHISDIHISATFEKYNKEKRSIGIKIGKEDKDTPDTVYLEAVTVFHESTKILSHYIDGWIYTKANPNVLDKVQHVE